MVTPPTQSPATAWPAPLATEPVDATVTLPGSKSHTNRALVVGALSSRPVRLRAPLRSRDSTLMVAGLRALGVVVDDEGAAFVVDAVTDGRSTGLVDCGNAGTVARFLPPVAALGSAPVRFVGDERMSERPLGPLLDALVTLGADVVDDGRRAVPFTITGPVRGGSVTVDASTSSQLVSGLLLSGARMPAGLTVRHAGPPVPSGAHLRMTVDILRLAGATVDDGETDVWRVEPGELSLPDLDIEPDLSTAAAFLAAAAATAGTVRVPAWPLVTHQPGAGWPALLEAMGCRCELGAEGLVVHGPDRLVGVDVDLRDNPEAGPTMAALAVLATTPTRLRGIAHLRLQETDRLAALSEELGLLGARVDVTDDGLAITPAPLHSPARPLNPRADHRLAMAYAVVGLVVPGVAVDDIATTGKTVPDFPSQWAELVAG